MVFALLKEEKKRALNWCSKTVKWTGSDVYRHQMGYAHQSDMQMTMHCCGNDISCGHDARPSASSCSNQKWNIKEITDTQHTFVLWHTKQIIFQTDRERFVILIRKKRRILYQDNMSWGPEHFSRKCRKISALGTSHKYAPTYNYWQKNFILRSNRSQFTNVCMQIIARVFLFVVAVLSVEHLTSRARKITKPTLPIVWLVS